VRERAIDRHSGHGRQRAQRSLDRVRVDGDEARPENVTCGPLHLTRYLGRRTADVDALDREDRRGVGNPVRATRDDQNGEAD
jgi:hypothetical protein